MNYLLLNGYGCKLKVRDNTLIVQTGGLCDNTANKHLEIKPNKVDFDRIIVNGKSGVVTFDAIKWLIKKKVSLVFFRLEWKPINPNAS